jgi:hypothetical protein
MMDAAILTRILNADTIVKDIEYGDIREEF